MEVAINFEIDPHEAIYRPDAHRWVAYIESLAKEQDLPRDIELSLTFTDNYTIQLLNAQYRHIDSPTDVLSFPQDMENGLLGDILVSLEKAQTQAEDKGHSLEDELALLVTHGFLHLLGHDHREPEEEKLMFDLQQSLMQQYFEACFGRPLPASIASLSSMAEA